jgi:hypothetical protein
VVLVVLLGDGRGGFPRRTVRRAGCCANDVAVGDFNRDGNKDLAVPGTGVLLGNGSGRFPVIRRGIPESSDFPGETVVPADLNRDRKLDLVVLTSSEIPASAYIALGDGNARFDEFELTAAAAVSSVAIGRFNADRWPDLATVSVDWENREQLRVLLGTRSGRPRLAKRYRVGDQLDEVEVADANGDGKSDLVVMGQVGSRDATGTSWVLLGKGAGSFRHPVRLARCCNGGLLEVGHFNRDRRPDIAATSVRSVTPSEHVWRLSIFMNNTTR